MSVVICIEGVEGLITTRPEFGRRPWAGSCWLKSYDPEAHDGQGLVTSTSDLAEAQRFADGAEAMDFYRQVSASRPWRADGEPNRPATAFTISIQEVP